MNTAKEEAKELILKYYELVKNKYPSTSGMPLAKECALIDINNTIDALETYDDMTERHLKREFPNYLSCELQNMEQDFRYYEQVKREIEKL